MFQGDCCELVNRAITSLLGESLEITLMQSLMQGLNERKVISEVYASFVLNTRRMSKPNMGSIFHINNQ